MTVIELAKRRASCAQTLEAIGMTNAYGRTAEQKVAADAQYALAKDAYYKADAEYRNAISSLSAEQLAELSQTIA